VPVDADRARTYAPVLAPRPRPSSSRYLSEEQRILIADLHRAGGTCAEIAVEMGRSTSTVSRELARNRDEYRGYRGLGAHRLAVARRARPRARRVESDPVLGAFVIGRLGKRWSPEQISHALNEEFGGARPGSWSPRASTRRDTTGPAAWVLSALVSCVPSGGGGVRTAVGTRASPAGWRSPRCRSRTVPSTSRIASRSAIGKATRSWESPTARRS
jgi:transposase